MVSYLPRWLSTGSFIPCAEDEDKEDMRGCGGKAAAIMKNKFGMS